MGKPDAVAKNVEKTMTANDGIYSQRTVYKSELYSPLRCKVFNPFAGRCKAIHSSTRIGFEKK